MKRTETMVIANRWCRLEVELCKTGELSICGTEGSILTRAQAKKAALSYWESFFEEAPEEIMAINRKCNKRFTSSTGAARFVIESDGEFHGLEVDHEEGNKVFVAENMGQITDTLREWFPEVAPYLRWHLNYMKAECEHQEARGETFKTHPSAVCPDCGYKLGSAWLKRDLPAEVIAWAQGKKAA